MMVQVQVQVQVRLQNRRQWKSHQKYHQTQTQRNSSQPAESSLVFLAVDEPSLKLVGIV